VKARARSDADATGRGSAVATLRLSLKTLLRLFAPFLPYITEEVWSWAFAGSESHRSIHRAAWPSPADFADAGPAEGGGAVFDVAVAYLDAVRRAKSAAGASVGRQLARLRVAASPRTAELLKGALNDALAAARVE
jgi:valyl-tRNA synthetase